MVRRRNATREARWAEERAALRPLPTLPLAPCRELHVRVGRFSTIQVLGNTYSVPARLIGAMVLVRARSETLELYRGTAKLLTLPRLLGRGRQRIDYRHLIWSLVRKPGAFANYRYHDDLFPTLTFRRAYDALATARPTRADREYVRVLHLAASTSEAEVEAALLLLLEQGTPPTLAAVRELVLPAIADQMADRALKAAKANLTHEAFLYEVVRAEVEQREQHRIARLRRRAGLPPEKTFRTLQLDRFPPTVRQQVERLRAGTFLAEAVNVVAVGRPGVGKVHPTQYPARAECAADGGGDRH